MVSPDLLGEHMGNIWLKSHKRMTIILAVMFSLVCFLGTSGKFPVRNIGTYLGMFTCIYWTMAERKRIIQETPKRYLSLIGFLLVLLYFLREARSLYFDRFSLVARYLWYLYYLPVLAVPLFSLFTAWNISLQRKKGQEAGKIILIMICSALLMGILTNDIHQKAFIFTDLPDSNAYQRGWIYYLCVGWIVLLVVFTFFLLLRRARKDYHFSRIWVPVLLLIAASVYLMLVLTGRIETVLGGLKIRLRFQDAFVFGTIAFWEACTQIGLIQSNTMYEDLFEESELDAQIVNRKGKVIYASHNATDVSKEDMQRADKRGVMVSDTLRLHKVPIRGGHVLWTEDMTPIQQLNDDLKDLADQLSEENVILIKENELRSQKAEYEIENELYDQLNTDLQGKIRQIETLINVDTEIEGQYLQNLRVACVYGAYLKRRANLYLITEQNPVVSVQEVELSVRESLEYLKLLKVQSSSQVYGDGELTGEEALGLYEAFESILEKLLPYLEACLVTVSGTDHGALQIAAVLKAEKIPGGIDALIDRMKEINGLSVEWDDGTLFLRWKKGGLV